MCGLLQVLVGRFTVDGVNHHLTRSNLLDNFKPWSNELFRSVVDVITILGCPLQKHCLNNSLAVEGLNICYDTMNIVGWLRWTVYLIDILSIDSIEFQNVVVYLCTVLRESSDDGLNVEY